MRLVKGFDEVEGGLMEWTETRREELELRVFVALIPYQIFRENI